MDSSSDYQNQVLAICSLLILFASPIFYLVPTHLYYQQGESLEKTALVMNLLFLVVFSIAVGLSFYWLRKEGRDILSLANLKGSPAVPMVFGAMVGLVWGLFFGLFGAEQLGKDLGLDFEIYSLEPLRIGMGLLTFFLGILEDLVTRAFIMDRLQRVGRSDRVQVLVSSMVFATYHTMWGFSVAGFIFSLIYGYILSQLYLSGNRSLSPVIFAHSFALLIGEPYLTYLLILSI